LEVSKSGEVNGLETRVRGSLQFETLNEELGVLNAQALELQTRIAQNVASHLLAANVK
jgi:hypothetical protein